MPSLRPSTHDRYDGQHMVCVSCHKIPKFCKCPPDAPETCPICCKPLNEGEHWPEVDCLGMLRKAK